MKILRILSVIGLIIGVGRAFNANALTVTNLYSFGSITNDGAYPLASLAQGRDGYFYGTTAHGGTSGSGTVFRISVTGNYTNLYSFGNLPDGQQPFAGLVQGSDSNFYGTTLFGGASGSGTVFRISATGSYSNLYSFGNLPDGQQPFAGLVQGSDSNFYGTTLFGGASGSGTVFRISATGSYSNLYRFGGIAIPQTGLVQGSDGNFYGTTSYGGTHGGGTVFKLTVPLNRPANEISQIQMSGADIIFAIPSVAGETHQLQFSSSLQPTNWVSVPGVSVANSIGASLTLTNFGGALGPQGFYRFAITP